MAVTVIRMDALGLCHTIMDLLDLPEKWIHQTKSDISIVLIDDDPGDIDKELLAAQVNEIIYQRLKCKERKEGREIKLAYLKKNEIKTPLDKSVLCYTNQNSGGD